MILTLSLCSTISIKGGSRNDLFCIGGQLELRKKFDIFLKILDRKVPHITIDTLAHSIFLPIGSYNACEVRER